MSREHSLNKVLSIGHDNAISVDGAGGIRIDAPDGEELESMGGIEERRVAWDGVVQTETASCGELDHGGEETKEVSRCDATRFMKRTHKYSHE